MSKSSYYTAAQIEAMVEVIKENYQFWNGKIPEEIQMKVEYKTTHILISVYQSRMINTSNSIDPREGHEREEIHSSEVKVTSEISTKDLINEVEKLIEEQVEINRALNL